MEDSLDRKYYLLKKKIEFCSENVLGCETIRTVYHFSEKIGVYKSSSNVKMLALHIFLIQLSEDKNHLISFLLTLS